MADFVSSLNGVQMDSALMDMAEHNSEAWAVGERNGVPVGSDDVTYQNNAQYYAQIATSHIEPGEIGDAVRWDTDQSTVLTDANKAQARKNIGAANTNPNLLDNWYFVGGGTGVGVFPINRRGQTYYGAGGYCIDRWVTDASLLISANGISTGVSAFYQNAHWEELQRLMGKTLTASLMYADGTIISGTTTLPSSLPSETITIQYGNQGLYTIIFPTGDAQLFRFAADNVAAVKLELGEISTLKYDPPPNYEFEYIKCVTHQSKDADFYSKRTIAPTVNPNILDNACFIGGGSHNGADRYPINQRGEVYYPAGQLRYTIDRWIATAAIQLDIGWNNITLSNVGGGDANFSQPFDHQYAQKFVGSVLTASIWYTDDTVLQGTFTCPDAPASGWQYTLVAEDDRVRLIWAVHQTYRFEFFLQMKTSAIGLKMAKLEYGTMSTIINSLPASYADELARCQRWLRDIPLTRVPITISGNLATLTLYDVNMRGVPAAYFVSSQGGVADAGGLTSISNVAVTGFTYGCPTVQFTLTAQKAYVVGYIYDTVIRLSCDI